MKTRLFFVVFLLLALLTLGPGEVFATHSWGPYHWARTANPFNLKLGDNVSSAWDSYLATASSDWSQSTVLDTTIVAGATRANCRATNGRVEVCNKTYGNNGWLGIASIWVNSGSHITQGTVKVNDTYFNTSTYNTTGWRSLVMCQEIGHTLGLDHQDANFDNPPITPHTCMDYFVPDPNEVVHPNQHDYDELGIIYSHLDSTTTLGQTISSPGNKGDVADADDAGQALGKDGKGHTSLYERDLGNGEKLLTFVLWAD